MRTVFFKSGKLICLIFICFCMGCVIPAYGAGGEKVKFLADDSLEEIRNKIEKNGYGFTVGGNWVFNLSEEERNAMLTRHESAVSRLEPAPVDSEALLAVLDEGLPENFDWRDYPEGSGRSYIGPIRDQGSCGSCYAFGAAAAAEGVYNKAYGLYGDDAVDFSESYIAWCLGRLDEYYNHFYGCRGSDYEYYEVEALTKEGVAFESDFPYQESDPGSCPYSGTTVVFNSWQRIGCNDIDAIKAAIMTYGVVDAAVYATSAFMAYDSGIYEDSNTSCDYDPCYLTRTNHIISLVGWNDNGDADNEGYWILRNSWGTGWGEDGYMRIKYTSAVVACEALYIELQDVTAPRVVSASPDDEQEDVELDAVVVATFSENMDDASLSAAFTVASQEAESEDVSGDAVDGTVTVDRNTATFTPASSLGAETWYKAVISTQATDEAGNPLAQEYSWTFKTTSGSIFVPVVSGGGGSDSGCFLDSTD